MLTAMRNAWEDAHRKANEAEDLERHAAAIDRELADEACSWRSCWRAFNVASP